MVKSQNVSRCPFAPLLAHPRPRRASPLPAAGLCDAVGWERAVPLLSRGGSGMEAAEVQLPPAVNEPIMFSLPSIKKKT